MPSVERMREEITAESRRHYAAFAFFNQAMADYVGLHPTDLQCLSLLALESEPQTVGQIAKLTGLTSGSATRLVDRLERAGLARRRADPTDARVARVELTALVNDEIASAWDGPGQAFGAVLARYNADELRTIRDFLQRTGEVGRMQAHELRSQNRLARARCLSIVSDGLVERRPGRLTNRESALEQHIRNAAGPALDDDSSFKPAGVGNSHLLTRLVGRNGVVSAGLPPVAAFTNVRRRGVTTTPERDASAPGRRRPEGEAAATRPVRRRSRRLGADTPRDSELRGHLACRRLGSKRKYVKRIHARDTGEAGRQFAR